MCLGPAALAHPDTHAQIDELSRRLSADASNAALYLQRGELYRDDADYAEAAADFERARQLDPHLRLLEFCMGKMSFEAGDARAALAHLNRFLAREQGDPEGLALRGRVLVRLGDPLAAAADYGLAIERRIRDGNPPPPELFIDRARALTAAGPAHQEEALGALDRGLEVLGRPVTLEIEALDLELRSGRTDGALVRVGRLIEASPRPESWLVRRGEILERAGRLADARRAYLEAADSIAALPPARKGGGPLAALERQARAALERIPADRPSGHGGGK